jgi:hypothetical protein
MPDAKADGTRKCLVPVRRNGNDIRGATRDVTLGVDHCLRRGIPGRALEASVILHRFSLSISAAALLFLVLPSTSLAQDRGFAAAHLGVTFQSETAAVFGGEFGANIIPGVAVYGTGGRMQDAMPNDIQDLLDLFGTDIEASIPAFYVMGGVKAGAPTGPIRPYGVFGAGFAHLAANFEFRGRDITSLIEDEIGESLTTNEFAFEIGAGVMIPIGAGAFFDGGYRYTRINGADINVSRVFGGVGVRF